jgi:signal transduction histidine kinase
MNMLEKAKKEFSSMGGDNEEAAIAAAISQAESLDAIAHELSSLGNTMRLLASLQTEIIMDLRSRKDAERAYANYLKSLAESADPLAA